MAEKKTADQLPPHPAAALPPAATPAVELPPPPQKSAFITAVEARVSDQQRGVFEELYKLVRMSAERHAMSCLLAESRGDDLPSFEASGAAEIAVIAAKYGSEHKL
jgi:hypothetical protein